MNHFETIILCLPLVLILLSIAFFPLLAANFWEKRKNHVLFSIATVSVALSFEMIDGAFDILLHAVVWEYIPFVVTLFSLFVLSCGICLNFKWSSKTRNNVIFLFVSSVFASLIGTTGAAMLFLRPFLAMNKDRKQKKHLVVFFIFLVANIGGLLSPLGDPPLLIGYIHGVPFLWCFKNLFFVWLAYVSLSLSALVVVDKIVLQRERSRGGVQDWKNKFSIKIEGYLNIFLLFCVALTLFLNNVFVKNILLLLFCCVSYVFSKSKPHFAPIKEVAVIFFAIFVAIAPVIFLLESNSVLIQQYIDNCSLCVNRTSVYFWLCGLTSSFLDNAPSYLLFFNIAGGDVSDFMSKSLPILKAIATSSVVMGAITYIGNAPNIMVKTIAEKMQIKMPSFFEYMAWSVLVIVPISLLVNFLLGAD